MKKSISNLVSVEFFGRLLGRGFWYVTTVAIVRIIDASALGAFSVALVIVRLGGSVSRFGLDTAAKKFIPQYSSDPSLRTGTIILTLGIPFVLGVSLSILLLMTAPLIQSIIGIHVSQVAKVLILGIPFFALHRCMAAITQGYKETKYAVYIRDFGQLGGGLLLIVSAALMYGTVEAVAWAYVFSLILSSIIGLAILYRLGSFSEWKSPKFKIDRLLKFSLAVLVIAIANPIILWSDVLILSYFETDSIIGKYQAAYETAILLSFGLVSVNAIFPSLVSDLHESDQWEQIEQVYQTVSKWVSAFTLFGCIFTILYGNRILSIFGSNFSSSYLALVLLAVGVTTDAIAGPAGYLLSMTGYERLETLNTVFVAVLNVFVNILLISYYGMIGAAAATGIAFILRNILRIIELNQIFNLSPISDDWSSIALPIIISTIIIVGLSSLEIHGIVWIVISVIISTVVFIIAIYLCSVTEKDRNLTKLID